MDDLPLCVHCEVKTPITIKTGTRKEGWGDGELSCQYLWIVNTPAAEQRERGQGCAEKAMGRGSGERSKLFTAASSGQPLEIPGQRAV